MKSEKRRYKIVGFRDLFNGNVRVILSLSEIVKHKEKKIGIDEMMQDPMSIANKMIEFQMEQMIHDTFLISQQEYNTNNYRVGDIIFVTIEKE